MPEARLAAHFLLLPELANSPPNEAIVSALMDEGYTVHLYAPGGTIPGNTYDRGVRVFPVEYGRRWLASNLCSKRWVQYDAFSATSENPLAVAGLLSWMYRRPSFLLVDEIKSGSYRGDAPEYWKKLCRWAMRRAAFSIVNDVVRVPLLREYAAIPSNRDICVYPGCYRQPPGPADRSALRRRCGIPEGGLLIGMSGGINLTSGIEWVIGAFQQNPSLYLMIQPVGMDAFAKFLLSRVEGRERMYVEDQRLDWREAWSSAAALDIGIVVYHNPAPQFQNMGVSSNRLCMFLAMGVPVIASRQPSFEFVERYDCGVLVDNEEEFVAAIDRIAEQLDEMKKNALRCAREYIDAASRYEELKRRIAAL